MRQIQRRLALALVFFMVFGMFQVSAYKVKAAVTATITYNGGGATGEMFGETVDVGTSYNIATNGFTYAGKYFTGWLGSDGVTYNPGGIIQSVSNNVTLTALWADLISPTNVTGNANELFGNFGFVPVVGGIKGGSYSVYTSVQPPVLTLESAQDTTSYQFTSGSNSADTYVGANVFTLKASESHASNGYVFTADVKPLALKEAATNTQVGIMVRNLSDSGIDIALAQSATALIRGNSTNNPLQIISSNRAASVTSGTSGLSLATNGTTRVVNSTDIGSTKYTLSISVYYDNASSSWKYNASSNLGALTSSSVTTIGSGSANDLLSFRLFAGGFNSVAAKAEFSNVKFGHATAPGAFTIADDNMQYPPRYRVAYDINTGTGTAPAMQNVVKNTQFTIAGSTGITAPSGMAFKEWNTKADGTGTPYTAGATVSAGISAETKLYAIWESNNPNAFKITYDANGGTNPPAASSSVAVGAQVVVAAPGSMVAPTGKSFAYWSTEQTDGGSTPTGDAKRKNPGDQFTMVQGGLTLYAVWTTAPTYTVTYLANGGTGSAPVDSASYKKNDPVTISQPSGLTAPTGMKFSNWNTSADGSGTSYAAAQAINMGESNLSLYAIWIPIPPAGPFNPDDFKIEKNVGVSIARDITYVTQSNYQGTSTDYKLDIYRPIGTSDGNRPVVIFVHGGGFRTNDQTKSQSYVVDLCKIFARKGYVAIAPDYRVRNSADMPDLTARAPAQWDAAEDINTLMTFLRKEENAAYYGYNPNYIGLAGGSAGGITVVGYTFADPAVRNFNYNGLIGTGVLWGSPEHEFEVNYIVKNYMPTFIVHGDADPTIPVENARRLYDNLKTAIGGNPAQSMLDYKEVPGGVHSLSNVSDRYTTWIVPGLDTLFTENMKKMIAQYGFKNGPVYSGPQTDAPSFGDYDIAILAKEDTYVQNDMQTTAQYSTKLTAKALELKKASTSITANDRIAYIKFDLSQFKNVDMSKIEKIVLGTTKSGNGGSGGVSFETSIFSVDSTWTETGLTWSNQPSLGDNPTGADQKYGMLFKDAPTYKGGFTALTADAVGTDYTADITAFIKQEVAARAATNWADPNLSVRLAVTSTANTSSLYKIFSHDEANQAYRPRLMAKYIKPKSTISTAEGISFVGARITGDFWATTYSYTGNITGGATKLAVTISPSHEAATYQVFVNGSTTPEQNINNIAITDGTMTIKVVMTAEDGIAKSEYDFTIQGAAKYTVDYNANGATGTVPASQTVMEGASVHVAEATGLTAPTGKLFAGWNTAQDGSGTYYKAGDSLVVTDNTTLYATWETPVAGSVYYLSSRGDDSKDGRSAATAWKSLSKIKGLTLGAGDKVLLERGSIFAGTLYVSGKGSHVSPITVEPYGTGAMPVINGTGLNPAGITVVGSSIVADAGKNPMPNAAIHVYNSSNIIVKNIEVTNVTPGLQVTGSQGGSGNYLAGVIVENNGSGLLSGITLDGIKVHDVTGFLASNALSKATGGIGFIVSGITDGSPASKFSDITVQNCTISRVNSTGIFLDAFMNWDENANPKRSAPLPIYATQSYMGDNNFRPFRTGDSADVPMMLAGLPQTSKRTWNEMKWSNVLIANNLINDTGKNAMIIRMTDETGVIENNIVYDISLREGAGNSVMSRTVYGTVFQRNEVYRNLESKDQDGCAFDADYYSPATIWQYNYSHDNNYGLITFCTKPTDDNVIVRYNISQNERGRILNLNYNFFNAEIYNNFFYIGKDVVPTHPLDGISLIWETFSKSGGDYTDRLEYKYYNNIVYSENSNVRFALSVDGKRNASSSPLVKRFISNNIFYGNGTAKPTVTGGGEFATENKFDTDPLVFYPGSGTSGSTVIGADWKTSLRGYMLRASSPAIGYGMSVPATVTDIFGGSVNTSAPSLGAIDYRASDMQGFPTLDFPAVTKVERFSAGFNPLSDVTARNASGTVIPLTQGNVTGVVNTQSLGLYYFVYNVTDNGKTTTMRRTVTVVPPAAVEDKYIATASSYTEQGTNASNNYSTAQQVYLKSGATSGNRYGYFTVTLPNDVSADFTSASFQFATESSNDNTTFKATVALFDLDMTQDPATWNPQVVTWNSQGTVNNTADATNPAFIAKTDVNMTTYPATTSIDITNYVKAKLAAGQKTFTFRLAATTTTTPYAKITSVNSSAQGAVKPMVVLTTSAISLDTDSAAKSIALRDGNGNPLTISPAFADNVLNYAATVTNEVSTVGILAEPNSSKALSTKYYLGDRELTDAEKDAIPLSDGDTVIKVKVTAEDFDISTTYQITVTRLNVGVSWLFATSDTYVEDGGQANANFVAANPLQYKLASGNSTNRAMYYRFATPAYAVARAVLNIELDANSGSNIITTTAGLFDLANGWEDTITWNTQPSIWIDGSGSDKTRGTGQQFGDLKDGVAEMGFVTKLTDERANKGNIWAFDITEYVNSKVAAGAADISFRIVPFTTTDTASGAKAVSLESTAQGSWPKIVLTKVMDTDSTAKSITVTDGTGNAVALAPAFVPGTKSYTAAVANAVQSVNVGAVANSSKARSVKVLVGTADFTGKPITLTVGANTVTVVITAEDTVTTSAYNIVITRAGVETPPVPTPTPAPSGSSSDSSDSTPNQYVPPTYQAPSAPSSSAPASSGSGTSGSAATGTSPVVQTVSNAAQEQVAFIAPVAVTAAANGSVTAEMKTENLAQLIEAAKVSESKGAASEIVLKADIAEPSTKAVTFVLPAGAVSSVVASTSADIKAETPFVSLTFNNSALSVIDNVAKTSEVKISISVVDVSTLDEGMQQKIGDRPVFEFSLNAGGTVVRDFDSGNGGLVTIGIPYTAKNNEKEHSIVVYYLAADGKVKTMQGRYEDGYVTCTSTHFSRYAIGYNEVSFSDVTSKDWFAYPVEFIAARGISSGIGGGKFEPNGKLTRVQALVMLMNAYGIDPEEAPKPEQNFADAGNTYYTGYLAKAKAMGITNGVGDNKFDPNSYISRQDLFTMMYNMLEKLNRLPKQNSRGKSLTVYKDASDVKPYSSKAMEYFALADIANGLDGLIQPNAISTRAQMASIIYQLLIQ